MRPATQNAPNSTSTLLRHNSIWLLQQQFRIAKKAYQTHTSWRVLVGKPGLLFRATAVLWNYVARILYHKYGRLSRGLGGFSNLGLSVGFRCRGAGAKPQHPPDRPAVSGAAWSALTRTGRCKKVYGLYLVFSLMHKGFIIANLLALPRASEGFPPSDTAPLSLFVKGASPPSPPQ